MADLEALVAGTVALVEARLPDVDAAPARKYLGARERSWRPLPMLGRTISQSVILAAQAAGLAAAGQEALIATTNAAHLARYATPRMWSDIR